MKPIFVTDTAHNELNKFKVHPSQPVWEVINDLIKIKKEVNQNDKKSG